jgi:hypothetical protein
MKKLFLAGAAALPVLSTSVAYAADESDPPLPRFQPWQRIWQCNDIRVTVTARDPFSIEYDLGARSGAVAGSPWSNATCSSTGDPVCHCSR